MSRRYTAEALRAAGIRSNIYGDPTPEPGPDDIDYRPDQRANETELDKTPPRFVPVAIDDVQINTEPAWLVHRILPARGLAFIVGPPKCGKSFLTTDLLFSVARSAPYAGRETLGGPVIYLTAEGVTGFKRRLVAIRQHYGVEGEGVPFFMIGNVPDLGSEQTDVNVLIRDLEQFITDHGLEQPRAIALDTLARCMGTGDENTARDMGRFINRCGLIERRFSCLVPVVHHVGKNPAQGGRGSNAQNGAADVTITVEKSEGYSTVRIDEMKDGPEGQEWRFRLVPFDLSETLDTPTETMSETSTCIVELLSDPTQAKPTETKKARAPRGVPGDLLKVIRRAIDEAGQRNVGSDLVPAHVATIDRVTLRRYCKTMAWQDQDEKPDAFRSMLSKTLSQLRAADAIGFSQDWIWLA